MPRSTIRIIFTAQMAYLMDRRSCLLVLGICLSLGFGVFGCGSGHENSGSFTEADIKDILQQLPYRYEFRRVQLPRGASAAIAGRVYGPHHTWFDFGIAIGNSGAAIPVPRAGVSGAVGNPGFVFTDNELVRSRGAGWEPGPQFHTSAQWDEASHMATEINERLCRVITGNPCPV